MSIRRTYESLAQAAERTGLSVKTLRRRIAEGKLQAYRSGRRILRVDPDDVDQMMRPVWARLVGVRRPREPCLPGPSSGASEI